MLENDLSQHAHDQMQASHQAKSYRAPAFAGRGYPADPNGLYRYLEQFIDAATDQDELMGKPDGASIRGLLSPHIDYPRGGPVYGAVWHHAAEAVKKADLVIMFGTDHYGYDPFTLTRQNYATPYGILPTAGDIVDKLARAIDKVQGDGASYNGELRHCNEHSLELVSVWLHHMLDKQNRIDPNQSSTRSSTVELVPILCGGMHHHIFQQTDPAGDPLLNCVLEVLHDVCADRNVLVVASGDLAHVGPAFSGAPLDQNRRTILRHADDLLLASMTQGDSHAFFEAIRAVEDRNNVCGVTPIYLTMRLLTALKNSERMPADLIETNLTETSLTGSTVAYDTCPADERDTSVVTIGGVLFS